MIEDIFRAHEFLKNRRFFFKPQKRQKIWLGDKIFKSWQNVACILLEDFW